MGQNGFFKNWIVKNILGAVMFLGLVLIAGLVLLHVVTQHNKELTVPDFNNLTVEEAEIVAKKHHMRVEVTDSVYVRRMERGTVYRQNPEAGSLVKDGRRILLTINAVMPKVVTMPDLVGYSTRQAKAELLSRGLQLGTLIYVNDIATNNVLRQLYRNSEIKPGTRVESESEIDLVVGLNNDDNLTYVPYVVGTRYMTAVNSLHDNSLNVGRLYFDSSVHDYSDSLNAVVYRQSPDELAEPYRMGTGVSLYLTCDEAKKPAMPNQTVVID